MSFPIGMSGPGWEEIYFDKANLIVTRDGDGGDTAQREGWAWFGSWIRANVLHNPWSIEPSLQFEETMALLEVGQSGQFRRHPTQPDWKSDPNGFSRDQLVPLIAAMGVRGDTARIQRSWNAMQTCPWPPTYKCVQGTKDTAMPDLMNLFKRALGQSTDGVGDGFLAGGVTTRLFQAANNPDDVGDDLNLIVQLLMALLKSPDNNVTTRAAFAYSKNRPVSSGCYLGHYRLTYPGDFNADEATMRQRIAGGISGGWMPDCTRVLGALRWYFRMESGGCPALAELYAPIVDQFLS